MPGNDTPRRTVRCEDELWLPSQSKAAAEGTNLSEVIRRLLTEWLKESATPEGTPATGVDIDTGVGMRISSEGIEYYSPRLDRWVKEPPTK